MCYSALVKSDLKYLTKNFGAIAIHKQVEDYFSRSSRDPKAFPPIEDRIYPSHYAPVIFHSSNAERAITFMRYNVYPPPYISDVKGLTTYNARRDNLTSKFWSESFMKHHGFIALEGFYEWVNVRTVLKAGFVTLDQVKTVFRKQAEQRHLKLLSAGKKYKPTPTELKDPLDRQIIIQFKPVDEADMIAPVIFSYGEGPDGNTDAGFAIVTDDPPFEILNAGHDRCPIILMPDALGRWLTPSDERPEDILRLVVEKKRQITFTHSLADLDE